MTKPIIIASTIATLRTGSREAREEHESQHEHKSSHLLEDEKQQGRDFRLGRSQEHPHDERLAGENHEEASDSKEHGKDTQHYLQCTIGLTGHGSGSPFVRTRRLYGWTCTGLAAMKGCGYRSTVLAAGSHREGSYAQLRCGYAFLST